MALQDTNITTIRSANQAHAVVFLHGFSGARDNTWDRFPALLGAAVSGCDIFTLGYTTTFLPDIVGVWSADPDLPILATMLCTQLGLPPFSEYASLTLVAHSMGGLIAQQALVDDPAIAHRLQHLILFGTPSAGLRKAHWLAFWKRQLNNMAEGSEFILGLRRDWSARYRPAPPFQFLVVAGASDQFVPPSSSLEPFDKSIRRVVVGDHLSIVKPATADSPSLVLVAATLEAGSAPPRSAASELRLAAERADADTARLVETAEASPEGISAAEVVDAALALDRAGHRAESIALLERHQDKHTDIKGSLGGRIKRLWIETENPEHARRALALYQEALHATQAPEQIYYLAINVAFLKFVFEDNRAEARALAALALQHAEPPGNDIWKTATVAEAYLYLDRLPDALAEYRRLSALQPEAWKLRSAALQAGRVAAHLNNRALADELETIFDTPR